VFSGLPKSSTPRKTQAQMAATVLIVDDSQRIRPETSSADTSLPIPSLGLGEQIWAFLVIVCPPKKEVPQ